MKIHPDHWLDVAVRVPYPAGPPMRTRRFLVMHFTGGWKARSSIDFWRTKEAKGAEAHVIIDRDGTILQLRPFDEEADHAGESSWVDPGTGIRYDWLNRCSIGIELANIGDLGVKVYPSTMGLMAGGPIPVITARHKNGGPVTTWEKYPDAQLSAAADLARVLVARYNLDDVVGHDDIAPKRKVDPGPAFPMQQFRRALGFPKLKPDKA